MSKSQMMLTLFTKRSRSVAITLTLILLGTWGINAQMKVGANPGSIGANSQLEVESVNGSMMVVLKDGGQVGIGTASPQSKLHVAGTIRADVGPGNGYVEISNGWAGVTGFVGFYRSDGVRAGYIGAHNQLTYVAENGSNHIFHGGRVGIGTDTPTDLLQVVGNSRLGTTWIGGDVVEVNTGGDGDRWSYIDFHSYGAAGAIDYAARIARLPGVDGHLDFDNPGAGGYRFFNGSVSIETGQLDVKSPHYFSGSFWNTGADGTSIAMVPANNWDLRNEFLNHANGDFSLWGGNFVLYHQRAINFIGIGTIAPQSKLHVAGTIRADVGPGNGYVEISNGWAGVTGFVGFYRSDGVRAGYIGAHNQLTYVAENGSNHIFHGGRVGIGTDTPTDLLQVVGNSRLGTTWIGGDVVEVNTGGDGDRWSYIDFHSHGAAGAIDYAARIARLPGVDGHLDFDNPGAGGYRFFNGSVSIETGQLDVKSPGYFSGSFWNTTTAATSVALVPANNWDLRNEFVSDANGDFRLWGGYNRIFVQRASGNLGIGVSDPWRPLDIGGEIRIRGGNPGEGKVLTSDLNGVATWRETGSDAIVRNATGYRDYNTDYVNTTGRIILVSTVGSSTSGLAHLNGLINGNLVNSALSSTGSVGSSFGVFFAVPPGATFRVNSYNANKQTWWETY